MAAAKRFTTQQIVAKLREAEKLQALGPSIPALCRRLQISDQTLYRWRLKYGALKEDHAGRLKALQHDNARSLFRRLTGFPTADSLTLYGAWLELIHAIDKLGQ